MFNMISVYLFIGQTSGTDPGLSFACQLNLMAYQNCFSYVTDGLIDKTENFDKTLITFHKHDVIYTICVSTFNHTRECPK